MIIHPLHNTQNKYVIKILTDGLQTITQENILKNYHPDYSNDNANLFYILSDGRYSSGSGTYFVAEEDGKYICSAGWNKYQYNPDTALVLSRMYVAPLHRGNYIVGSHILPICIGESIVEHSHLWMTYHIVNNKTKKWFDNWRGKTSIPSEYKKFNYIGVKTVYYTEQYVYQYCSVK